MIMDKREFVAAIRSEVLEDAIVSVKSNLNAPPGRKPSERMIRLSTWFNNLDESNKSIVLEIIRESAETSVFGFFCVLDGVRSIESNDKEYLNCIMKKQHSVIE
jgi:hypothetical protein